MRFGSVCSGIEAASVAWHPLGWQAAWLAEIEPFPAAVLAHHYPDTPNLGDMTKIGAKVLTGDVEAPDVLVGGTPCQAFSVAGLREGLSDGRGQLTIKFMEIANAIDFIRQRRGEEPAIIVWENVPGVLSDKTGAFGCFLAGLAGESVELQPPGGKWSNAGCVFGPQRTIAWRVVDAQFFGVAQRRRRVFVVASARAGFDPAAVLFEFDGVRRDIAPSREAGEEVTPTIRAGATNGSPGHGQRSGDSRDELILPVASTGSISHYLNAGGSAGAKWPADIAPTLNAHFGEKQGLEDQHINGGAGLFVLHGTQDPCTDKHLAFAMGRNSGQENVVALSVALRGREGGATAELGDEVGNCLRASSGGGDKAHVLAPVAWSEELTASVDVAGTIQRGGAGGRHDGVMTQAMRVRRLTPVECERLQGFPDSYTMIPWRKKPADDCPDGPRYKSLGNSMCTNVMAFIGSRIDAAVNAEKTTKKVSA